MLYEVIEYAYLLIFILFRTVFWPICAYQGVMAENVPKWMLFSFITLILRSFYFIKIMIRILFKKQQESKARSIKGVSLWLIKVNPDILNMDYAQQENFNKRN